MTVEEFIGRGGHALTLAPAYISSLINLLSNQEADLLQRQMEGIIASPKKTLAAMIGLLSDEEVDLFTRQVKGILATR